MFRWIFICVRTNNIINVLIFSLCVDLVHVMDDMHAPEYCVMYGLY